MTTREDKPMPPDRTNGWSTMSIHGGEEHEKPYRALTDPIYCSSTYTFANTQAIIDFIVQKQPRPEYARYGNPNEKTVERKLAALEGAETAVLYTTGMSAIAGLLLTKLRAGDEMLLFDECYLRTREFCLQQLPRLGITARIVPNGDYEALAAAITPATRLLFSESPTNPHLSVVDLERFAAIGKRYGVETAIDATLATPYNVRPLALGVDYVLHSCTKYLAGHNDLLAGVIAGSAEKLESLRNFRGLVGLINAPHNEHLLLRGLKTFELRCCGTTPTARRWPSFSQAIRASRRLLPRLAQSSAIRDCPADDARRRRRGDVYGEGGRLAGDGRRGRCGAHSADRGQSGRGRIAHRAAVGAELLRIHARRATGAGDSRQHDPPFLRTGERARI